MRNRDEWTRAPHPALRATPGHMPAPLAAGARLDAAQYNRTHVRNIGHRQCNRGDPAESRRSARGRPSLSTECPQSVHCRHIDRPADPKRNRARNLDVVVPLNGIPQYVVFLGLDWPRPRAYIPSGARAAGWARIQPGRAEEGRAESTRVKPQGGSKPRPSQLSIYAMGQPIRT